MTTEPNGRNLDGQTPVSDLLLAWGADTLTPDCPLEAIQAVLEQAAKGLNGQGDLTRALVREGLIRSVRGTGARSPAAIVDAAIKPKAVASADERVTIRDFSDPEPFGGPVDGEELLAGLVTFVESRLVVPAGAAVAIAAWDVATWARNAFNLAPLLVIRSATRRAGKSLLLEMLDVLVRRPLLSVSISPAALYRSIETYEATLLIDEGEALGQRSERADELRALINAGYRRGAMVPRCVGQDNELRLFDPFGPKAIAAVGRLHDTIEDRGIHIRLQRKLRTEKVERFRAHEVAETTLNLRRAARRWVDDNLEDLKACKPALPDFLHDREQDSWEPLLAIAECVGGVWPALLTEAARRLSTGEDDDDQSDGIRLLRDIQTVFTGESMATPDLVRALVDLEGAEWAEYGRQAKPLTAHGLARLLKPFEVKPRQLWIGQVNCRGYELEDFGDAFSRYLGTQSARVLESNGGATNS